MRGQSPSDKALGVLHIGSHALANVTSDHSTLRAGAQNPRAPLGIAKASLNPASAPREVPIAPLQVSTSPTRIVSSAAHGWDGTLAFDIAGTPAGECRHEHEHLSLQLWWQPLSMRELPGGSWRNVEPAARLWLPGERQHFEWRRTAHVNIIFVRRERVERILAREYPAARLSAWQGHEIFSPCVARIVAAIAEDITHGCPAGPIVGDSLVTALVAYLDAGPSGAEPMQERAAPSARCFDRALQYIEENLTLPLRVAELAQAAGCSPKQLSRAFRERKGKLPHTYVVEKRVERATTLIAAGQLGLGQIAAAAGFADQSQMTKMFRKVLGTTPGRWRKQPQSATSDPYVGGPSSLTRAAR